MQGTSPAAEPPAEVTERAEAGPGRRRSGRKSLSRDEIVEAAKRITSRHGLDGLTMRSLADELGIHPSTTYYYVPDKSTLVALVSEEVLSGVEIPGPEIGDWAVRLRRHLLSGYAALKVHPGLIPTLFEDHTSPVVSRMLDFSMSMLREAGLGADEAYEALIALLAFNVGQVFHNSESTRHGSRTSLPVDPDADEYPALAGISSPDHFDLDRIYADGIDVFLDGLRARLARRNQASSPTSSA